MKNIKENLKRHPFIFVGGIKKILGGYIFSIIIDNISFVGFVTGY
jgi:hypothetical protein